MTQTIKRMTLDEWEREFRPVKNHLDLDSSFDGEMFETYGDEVNYIISKADGDDYLKVWTYVDGGTGTFIIEGYRLVNRIGHFITEVPAEEKQYYEVLVSEDE